MQISSSVLPIQVNHQQREQQGSARNQDAARREERLAAGAPRPDQEQEAVARSASSGSAASATAGETPRVEASVRSESSNFQRVRSFDELPLNSRNALDSYQSTAQSSSDSSASQLAGVDLFV